MTEIYRDTVIYSEKIVELAYRDGSMELNKLSAKVIGYRANVNGCWYIVSMQNGDDPSILREKLDRKIRYDYICGEFAEAELFKGHVEIGREFPDEDELHSEIKNLCLETKALEDVRCEAVLTMRNTSKVIERENGDRAVEHRKIIDIEISMLGKTVYGVPFLAASRRALIPWSKTDVIKILDGIFRETHDKLRSSSGVKGLKPYLYGKTSIVLSKQSTAMLIHEISHLLDASHIYSAKVIGTQLASKDVELYDDPHDYEAPSIRFFDDEGVRTRKRSLIEEGVVRDLHHTRVTAKSFGSEPGSAYGLFSRPIPFHSVLILKPGDWKDKEIIEETRNGFYVNEISMATLEKGYIRLIPEMLYLIENGELKESVAAHEIKIPFIALRSINAISRDLGLNISIEKGFIVAEKAPTIRLEGYIS
ncbi:peptidase U62 modulator of DNA gyrase [Ignisphaera aggregans DSM 17230]|uniref:Peptidase U62 modulator of DNA gyrase n=1 Tax=Ignisphaera aggregans (strain DSM 17230 / JCM 13409 / AQ1.S1) TaxID=583356 RepID=E0SSN9_IGNAA|nr:peptidase U62 modulator of DNA gyrase [Ignisphaera aggregans DSM 17230]